MEKHRFYPDLRLLRGKYLIFLLSVFLSVSTTLVVNAQGDEDFESTDPILISEADSTKGLTANPDSWRGSLPEKSAEYFPPGSRVVVFITNVYNEKANAFRAFAEDTSGNQFRLTVEDIQPLPKQDWIYALTLQIHDENAYNGQPLEDSGVLVRVQLSLGKSVAKFPEYPGMIPTPAPKARLTQSNASSPVGDRKRFMEQAAFGPNNSLDFRLRQIGLRRWIEEQFNKPYPTIPYPNFPQKPTDDFGACGGPYGTNADINLCHRNHLWQYNNQNWLAKEALYGEDQLRRRTSWALHQIWVVSANTVYQQRWMQEYVEILDNNAFGNYRNLMKEMTTSPAMGEYLDMVRSTRQNPNENYPRELLQLFSVGLYMLNQDGTLMLDGQGNRIPTYDQEKINQFTKVFTGWTQCTNASCPNAVVSAPNFIDPMYLAFPGNHDQTAKTLFNYTGAPNPTINACANCTTDAARTAYATDSLDKTLDNIFYHPNVGPFVGKLMIQHLVTSDPSPAYVSRVAAAFNNNGAGVRGDMKAVVRAILLDPEARGGRKNDPNYGKLREPLQYLTNYLRTFNVRASTPITVNGSQVSPPASCQNKSDGVISWRTEEMGQNMLAPATVFSYFSPDYVVPGTDVRGPEFALANTSTSVARNNQMMGFSFEWNWFDQATTAEPYPYTPCGTSIDLTEPTAWATADPSGNTLIEGLNTKMMHGTMSDAMKTKIRTAITFNVSARNKAQQAVFLVASSSQYQIQR
jgi:uncharacterized protein (DUF1800 family)